MWVQKQAMKELLPACFICFSLKISNEVKRGRSASGGGVRSLGRKMAHRIPSGVGRGPFKGNAVGLPGQAARPEHL